MAIITKNDVCMCLIGDEDTVAGFLLAVTDSIAIYTYIYSYI